LPQQIQYILTHDTVTLASVLTLEKSTARIEIQSLLQKILNVQRVYLLAHPERLLSDTELIDYQHLLQRRLSGEPIAYLLGEREFYGLNLKVTPKTLIPRPDTELLVDLAIKYTPQNDPCDILDLGTGCGAIALAIAQARPLANVMAVDTSVEALTVAIENAHSLEIKNTSFVQSDWFEMLGVKKFELIISNPPYIAMGDPHLSQGDVRYEPLTALVSGIDGLDDIRRIIKHSPSHLLHGGWLILEHGYDQARRVCNILSEAGFDQVFSACDLAGIERVSGGQFHI